MSRIQECGKHHTPLKYSRKLKMWYCFACLKHSDLVLSAQEESNKRYSSTDKRGVVQRRYEQSEKGKLARKRANLSVAHKESRRLSRLVNKEKISVYWHQYYLLHKNDIKRRRDAKK